MNTQKIILALIFGLISVSFFAQKTIWIDAYWNSTTKENATFYRTFSSTNQGLVITDFYKDGKKYREGSSKSSVIHNESFFGLVTYFFENGKISKTETYDEGVLDGDYSEFYDSGNLKESGKYEDGKREGIWKTYYETGKIKIRGKYREGEKVGVWKTYYKNVY